MPTVKEKMYQIVIGDKVDRADRIEAAKAYAEICKANAIERVADKLGDIVTMLDKAMEAED